MKADNMEALNLQALLSKIILVAGILLMTFTIYTESEPGALPLFFSTGEYRMVFHHTLSDAIASAG